jgi:hypothetical protein
MSTVVVLDLPDFFFSEGAGEVVLVGVGLGVMFSEGEAVPLGSVVGDAVPLGVVIGSVVGDPVPVGVELGEVIGIAVGSVVGDILLPGVEEEFPPVWESDPAEGTALLETEVGLPGSGVPARAGMAKIKPNKPEKVKNVFGEIICITSQAIGETLQLSFSAICIDES